MTRWFMGLTLGWVVAAAPAAEMTVDAEASATWRATAARLVEQSGEQAVVVGGDGWLFFVPELRHLAAGPFWGDDAAKVSRASRPDWADPLPIIVDFHEQVKKAGAVLVFVPVPPKAAIYPDKLPDSPLTRPERRVDEAHAAFIARLREQGVNVLDLVPLYLAYRREHGDDDPHLLYCRTDTHWSPRACELTAQHLHEAIAGHLPEVERREAYELRDQPLTFIGDLTRMLPQSLPHKPETLPARVVADRSNGQPPADRRESPVLLVGDSHLLVFHLGGDMHAAGAGLAAHLAHRLDYPADVVGVRGSGASPSRISLLRRGDNLAGKRVVVWLLTSREYTETQGWRPVPVVK